MAFNEKKYLKYFEGFDLSEKQKLDRIRTLKNILEHFVDAAFGQHPVQLCQQEKYLQSPDGEVESNKPLKIVRNEARDSADNSRIQN